MIDHRASPMTYNQWPPQIYLHLPTDSLWLKQPTHLFSGFSILTPVSNPSAPHLLPSLRALCPLLLLIWIYAGGKLWLKSPQCDRYNCMERMWDDVTERAIYCIETWMELHRINQPWWLVWFICVVTRFILVLSVSGRVMIGILFLDGTDILILQH